MFVVTVGLALVGQAAQFDWQYGAVKADVGKTVYVLLGTTAQTSWASVAAIEAAAVDSAEITKKGVKYNAGGTAVSSAITPTSASAYYIIVDADKSAFAVTSVADMTGSVYDPAAQQTSSGSNTSLSSSSITQSGITFGGGGGGSGGGVPEPTSGLLLALGGAMLALRRKRA